MPSAGQGTTEMGDVAMRNYGAGAYANAARFVARRAAQAAYRQASINAFGLRPARGVVTKRLGTRAAGPRMRKYIKRVVNGTKELHFVDYNWGKSELNHNNYVTGSFNPHLNGTAQLPPQGDGDSNRTGNNILCRGIQLKCMFGCKQDRHNCTFRVLAYKCSKGYNIGTYGQIFDNQTGNVMLDGVDKDRVKVIFDKKVHYKPINPSPDGKEITIFRKFWIPSKAEYKFYDDGAQDNSYPYDIRVCVLAYDAYGSLITDNIGYVQCWSRFYFVEK